MLLVVEPHNRADYPALIDAVHMLRAKVFKERLQWDVTVEDGREIDQFDSEDPLYLLSVNKKTQRLEGCVRLLPTTGPNMLRDVFPVLLPEGEEIESPIIWESSRFCIDPELPSSGDGRINRTTTELLCGLVEVGLKAGLSHIVSVYDARMARIFRTANCPAETIGTPVRIGRVLTHAGLFEITPQLRDDIARAGGLTAPVLSSRVLHQASAA
jgi:acyl homoserine lactone synthase